MPDACRRPIQDTERPYLASLGTALADARRVAGLSQAALAAAAEVTELTVWRIENGWRRTRRSTLGRIVTALRRAGAIESEADELGRLMERAGPALAPESVHRERVEQSSTSARFTRMTRRILYEGKSSVSKMA